MRKIIAILLSLLILSALLVPVFAEDSPSGDIKYKIDIYYDLDPMIHDGTVTVPPDTPYDFTPKSFEGYIFDKIEITGEYEIVQNGNTYTIIAKSDLIIHVKFKQKTTPPPDDHDSPPTGTNNIFYFCLMLVALTGIAVSVRKLVKNR